MFGLGLGNNFRIRYGDRLDHCQLQGYDPKYLVGQASNCKYNLEETCTIDESQALRIKGYGWFGVTLPQSAGALS